MSDWKQVWAPLVAAVGAEAEGERVEGADAVDRSSLRRYLEPLEFDCPLHHDDGVARAHGYDGVIAPLSSYMTFAIPPVWNPGGPPAFTSHERDAEPAAGAVRPPATGFEPPYTDYFATDYEVELCAPVYVGDRLSRAGVRLVACEPKETRVGRGAFTTWERRYENQRGETVARMRIGFFLYNRDGATED
jgi:hypothetical protein